MSIAHSKPNIALRVVLLVVVVLLATPKTPAQAVTAVVSGICRDQQGVVITGVSVSITSTTTGLSRSTVTDDFGRYYVAMLEPGTYAIECSHEGFRTEVRHGVNLTVGRETVLDFVLQVGRIEERVEITADGSLIDRSSPALSELVDEKKIRDLPLNGRDIAQLIQLQTGVIAARSDVGEILTGGKGVRITVAGMRPSTNTFMLDGTIINNLGNRVATGATGQLTGVETVREFRVLTSSYSAEYSRVSGGAFNIVTRSGSNDLHGSIFEFIRNDNLDARNFFDVEKPEFRRNQFGFSLGGPIVRNRTFFFGSYEGLRENTGRTAIRTVPDQAARNGIVAGVRVDVDPVVRPYLDLWPQPTIDPVPGDGSAIFIGQFDGRAKEDFFTTRVDHYVSENHSAMARYTFSDSSLLFINDENFPQFPNRLLNRSQYLTLRATSVLSHRATNEVRFGFARSRPAEDIALDDPLTQLAFIGGQAIGTISISGFDVFGTDRNLPRRLTQNSFQVGDNLVFDRGRHFVMLGGQFERFHYNVLSSSRARGEFTFRTLSDFLSGRARTFEGLLPTASDVSRSYRQNLFGWFIQNEFKASRRLSLSFGLRHEFVSTPTENHGRLNNLHDPLDAEVTVGKPFITAKANFAPRAGFAWDITGNGKTVLRGGAGIFHDLFLAHQWWNSLVRLPPFAITARASDAAARFPDALSGLNPLGLDAVFAVDFDHKQPYVYQYNLILQQELFGRTVITAAYVGSRGINLARESDWNIGQPGEPVRRNPNFTRIRFRTWDASSFYNSFQLGINRRFRSGFQVQGSYTLSRSVDDASSGLGRSEFNNGQQRTSDPFDPSRDRGLSSFDVRQNLSVNFTFDLPFGPGQRIGGSLDGFLGNLIAGWQLNGIATLASGVPFTPIIINDLDRDGTDDNEQRPNLKPGRSNNPVIGRVEQWFDPTAFESLSPGMRGNLGRNTIIGPGLAAFDFSLAKRFSLARIKDTLQGQFRVEVFNLFNRANFSGPPRTNLEIFVDPGPNAEALPNTGRITSTVTTSRQMQFALRLTF